jgi:tripartite-type tricarboxylate transporter receptor subunit TctC
MFRTRAGLDMVHVPYKGAAPPLTELVGGQVTLVMSNPLGSTPLVKAGRLRPLAVTGAKRLASLPDVPTLAEAGLPGFHSTFFLGLLGPAGLPREIVERLNKETAAVLQRAEIQSSLATQGMEAVGGTPEALAARIRSDSEAMAKVIREAGLKLGPG